MEILIWNGIPHVELPVWNSHGKVHIIHTFHYATRYHSSTHQYSTRRIPTLVCGQSSGIYVWTLHGAQLLKWRWRCGIPLVELTIRCISFFLYCIILFLLCTYHCNFQIVATLQCAIIYLILTHVTHPGSE